MPSTPLRIASPHQMPSSQPVTVPPKLSSCRLPLRVRQAVPFFSSYSVKATRPKNDDDGGKTVSLGKCFVAPSHLVGLLRTCGPRFFLHKSNVLESAVKNEETNRVLVYNKGPLMKRVPPKNACSLELGASHLTHLVSTHLDFARRSNNIKHISTHHTT